MKHVLQHLPIAALVEPETNPNVMPPAEFDLLVAAMRQTGAVQPVLVREATAGRYAIIDGVHRTRAARAVGLESIHAVVLDCTEGQARALQLGMNRLRGHLDLSQVASSMAQIAELEGAMLGDVATLTGFPASEIHELLSAMESRGRDVPPDLGTGVPAPAPPPPEEKGGTFDIVLKFDSKKERDRVQRVLKRAGSGDLIAGVLSVIDAASPQKVVSP